MINNAAGYSSIIHALREVDGETMQWILEQAGQRDQMLKQLVLTAKPEEIEELVTEYQEVWVEELEWGVDIVELERGGDNEPEYDGAGFSEEDRIINGQYRVINADDEAQDSNIFGNNKI